MGRDEIDDRNDDREWVREREGEVEHQGESEIESEVEGEGNGIVLESSDVEVPEWCCRAIALFNVKVFLALCTRSAHNFMQIEEQRGPSAAPLHLPLHHKISSSTVFSFSFNAFSLSFSMIKFLKLSQFFLRYRAEEEGADVGGLAVSRL